MYSNDINDIDLISKKVRFKIFNGYKTGMIFIDMYGMTHHYSGEPESEDERYEFDDKNRLIHSFKCEYVYDDDSIIRTAPVFKVSHESWIKYNDDYISVERCRRESCNINGNNVQTTDTTIIYSCKNTPSKMEKVSTENGIETSREFAEYDECGNLIHGKLDDIKCNFKMELFNEYKDGKMIHAVKNITNDGNTTCIEVRFDYDEHGNVIYAKTSKTGEPDFESWKEYNENGDIIMEKDSTGRFQEYKYAYYPDNVLGAYKYYYNNVTFGSLTDKIM